MEISVKIDILEAKEAISAYLLKKYNVIVQSKEIEEKQPQNDDVYFVVNFKEFPTPVHPKEEGMQTKSKIADMIYEAGNTVDPVDNERQNIEQKTCDKLAHDIVSFLQGG